MEKKIAGKENFIEKVEKTFVSVYLDRSIRADFYIPRLRTVETRRAFSLLIFNDGQDLNAVGIENALADLSFEDSIKPTLVVGVHPNNRMEEYGTAHQSDYKNRGERALDYTKFIMWELLPFLEREYRISRNPSERVFAGFSLGGLSAFDIVWNRPTLFGKVGVFSGSLWWRSVAFNPKDPDGNRIAHQMVEDSELAGREHLKFWFEAGTEDEKEDRNNNGVIDAIDDTVDLIAALEDKGINRRRSIKYIEIEGGKHHPSTWKKVLPDFLLWAFEK